MSYVIKKFFQILFCFFCVILLDILWFTFMGESYEIAFFPMKDLLNKELTASLLWASVIVYCLLASSIPIFILPRLNPKTDWVMTFLWGGFLGMIIYGVYDLTNFIIFKDWPLRIALMDIGWGFILFGLTTLSVRYATLLGKRILRY